MSFDRAARIQWMMEEAKKRVLLLDGSWGVMMQGYKLSEDDYRGKRFAGHNSELKGNNDLLTLTQPEIVPFGPERFAHELARLEALGARELKRGAAFLLRPHTALAQLFFDSIAMKAVHVFEIADREARAWIGAFIRPLEAEILARQERTNSRLEGIGRMQDAEGDLVQRLDDVKALVRELAAMRDELEAHAARLERLLA